MECTYQDWVTVKAGARQRLSKAAENNLCVACQMPLEEAKVVRGCHEKCYRATVRAINRGDINERETIAAGKLLPPKTGGGRPTNPITIEARSRSTTRAVQHQPPHSDKGPGKIRQPSDLEPAKGELTVNSNESFFGVDDDIDLNVHLGIVQCQIYLSHGVSIDLEDLLWQFFRTSHRDMSICTEVIVETANDRDLLKEFSRKLLVDGLPQR